VFRQDVVRDVCFATVAMMDCACNNSVRAALGILSLLAGMAVDDGDSRGQWRLSRYACNPRASLRERRRPGHGHGCGQFSVNAPSE